MQFRSFFSGGQTSGESKPPKKRLTGFTLQRGDQRVVAHLRSEVDGTAALFIDANQVLQLNSTAAKMAQFYLEGMPVEQALASLRKIFRASHRQLVLDYAQFVQNMERLLWSRDHCLIHDFGFEVDAPFSHRPTAPYRMDLALTYRCNNDCLHCYNDKNRAPLELTTAQWIEVISRLAEIGIPHVVFTGGEPTLRPDLPDLIRCAHECGLVTGLNTNGRRLSDPSYLQRLLESGLDHIQITLESHAAEIHDAMVHCNGAWKQTTAGIKNAVETKVYLMTNTTMLSSNSPTLEQTLEFLNLLKVPTIGLNALIHSGRGSQVDSGLDETQLAPLLDEARNHVERTNQRLIWYTPTQYCHFDPVSLDLGIKGCSAALYNMCIEPDGGVIPCQSYYSGVGNFLLDPWDTIWNHELCIALRDRRHAPQACQSCGLFSECGGGCPLAMKTPNKMEISGSPL